MPLTEKIKEGLKDAKELTGEMSARVADAAEKLAARTSAAGPPPVSKHLKDVTHQAVENEYFRHVLATTKHTQVVVMSIPPGGEIGEEVHPENDQILFLVDGAGQVVLEGEAADFAVGDVVLVAAGTRHNFRTTGATAMKIITAYAPPHHADGTIHETKAEADAAD